MTETGEALSLEPVQVPELPVMAVFRKTREFTQKHQGVLRVRSSSYEERHSVYALGEVEVEGGSSQGTYRVAIELEKQDDTGDFIQRLQIKDKDRVIYRLDASTGPTSAQSYQLMKEALGGGVVDLMFHVDETGAVTNVASNFAETRIEDAEALTILSSPHVRTPADCRELPTLEKVMKENPATFTLGPSTYSH